MRAGEPLTGTTGPSAPPPTDQEAEGSNPSGRATTSDCFTKDTVEDQCSGKTIEVVA